MEHDKALQYIRRFAEIPSVFFGRELGGVIIKDDYKRCLKNYPLLASTLSL
jgi:hypothetical protein